MKGFSLRSAISQFRLAQFVSAAIAILFCNAGVSWAQEVYPDGIMPYGRDFLTIPEVEFWNNTSPRTVELLGRAFDAGETVPRRVELVRDLGACKLPVALPYLIKAMAEPDALVRAEAARSSGMIGDASILPTLRTLLDDSDESVRREVIVAGAILKDEAIVLEGLKSDDPVTLGTSLTRAFSPAHATAIVARLQNLPPVRQVQAIVALGRIGSAQHEDAVVGFLPASVPLKVAALTSLGKMKATKKLAEVEAYLNDMHPTVRREALRALAGVAPVDVRQKWAIEKLSDTDIPIRTVAAVLLTANPTGDAVVPLIAQLSVDDQPLHEAALAALVSTGAASIPAIVNLMDDADSARQIDALYVLWKLKSDAALEKQIALAGGADWPVSAAAARALSAASRSEAIPILSKLALSALQSQTGQASEQARGRFDAIQWGIIGCGALNHPDIVAPLMPLLPQFETQPSEWRAALCWAIGATQQTQYASALMGIPGNQKDQESVKIEAIKAMGNMRHKPAIGLTGTWSTGDVVARSPVLRYITHWAHSRITGENIPFIPIRLPWDADVSIRDVPKVD